MLFIFYTPIASIFVCATSWWALPPLHAAVSFDDPQLVNFVFMYIVTAVFGVMVLVLLVMHAWLAGKNLTTIEFLRMQDTDSNPYPYDAGCLNNVEQRFGTAWLTWPLPIKPSVDAHRGGSLV
jgi:hypothetical protein